MKNKYSVVFFEPFYGTCEIPCDNFEMVVEEKKQINK